MYNSVAIIRGLREVREDGQSEPFESGCVAGLRRMARAPEVLYLLGVPLFLYRALRLTRM